MSCRLLLNTKYDTLLEIIQLELSISKRDIYLFILIDSANKAIMPLRVKENVNKLVRGRTIKEQDE